MNVIGQLQCQRCGHTWLPRLLTRPIQCPRCTSRIWDKPKDVREPQVSE